MASSLRSFRREDAAAVAELSRHALGRPEDQVGNPLWSSREEVESELADWDVAPEQTLLVDEEDGRVVAFGGVEVGAEWQHADLFGPFVAPDRRGRRIGAALVSASIERARERSVERILASVGMHNVRGRIVLERAGFRPRRGGDAVFRLEPRDHRPVEPARPLAPVRRGEPADLDAVLSLYRECFPDGVFPEAAWRHALERGTVYLAGETSRPLAVFDIDASDRWVYHVGVTKSEREHGVGGYLVSEALRDYWERHPGESLGLAVKTDNLAALRLLRRQGFAPWLVLQLYELEL